MAQCPKCGNQVKPDAKFCLSCGSMVSNSNPGPKGGYNGRGGQGPNGGFNGRGGQGPNGGFNGRGGQGPNGGFNGRGGQGSFRGSNPLSEEERKRIRKRNIIIASVIGAIIVTMIAALGIYISMKPRVKLNKYIVFEVAGYNTIGRAGAYYEYEELYKNYSRAIQNFDEMMEECVNFEIDKTDNISNGDVVTLKWKCDDKKAKEKYGCVLKHSDIKLKVKDLEQVKAFDAFDGISVKFEGMDGRGKAIYEGEYNGNIDLYYHFDKSEDLSNGDTVKLWVNDFDEDDSDLEWFVEEYGMIPTPLYTQYTVSVLGKYVTSSNELTVDVVNRMKKRGEEYYNSNLSNEFYRNGETFKGIDYLGYYLLVAKDGETDISGNKVYCVYKAHVLNTTDTYRKNNDIYWYMSFENLSVSDQGDVQVDLEDYGTPYDTCSVTLGMGWGATTWTYHGYENLNELYEDVVSSQTDSYNHEDNVSDNGQGSSTTTTESTTESTTSSQPTTTGSEKGIIFPDSSTRYLTQSEVSALTKEQIRAAINEIFAREGYIFKDKELGNFYKQFSWYKPTVPADQFEMDRFNEYEYANVELLQKEREKKQ